MHWPNKSQCGYGYEHLSSISDNRNVAIYIEICNNTIYNMICRHLFDALEVKASMKYQSKALIDDFLTSLNGIIFEGTMKNPLG